MNPRRSCLLSVLVLAAAGLHFGAFPLEKQPLVTDVSFFVYFARRTAGGAVPYRDFLDYKTPLAVTAGAIAWRAGEAVGVDPLLAVRAIYLLFAALAALLCGLVLRECFGRRPGALWAGALCYVGFRLLGLFPSMGNMPKQLTLVCAFAAFLAVAGRRWMLSGLLAAGALLDWQPGGGLACLAVLLAAGIHRGRGKAVPLAAAGMVLAVLPFAAWFACTGALGRAVNLAFLAPLARPEAAGPGASSLERLVKLLSRDCAGETWLSVLGVGGLLLLAGFLLYAFLRRPLRPHRPLAAALFTYHLGIAAWSAVDFQGAGDLFILLGSLAFSAAFLLCAAWYGARRAAARALRRRRAAGASAWSMKAFSRVRSTLAILFFGLLVLALRPAVPWARPAPGVPTGPVGYTLSDQRKAARAFAAALGGARPACLDFQETLVLGGMDDALGFVFYDPVIHRFARTADEGMTETLLRRLDAAAPAAVVLPQRSRRRWLARGRIQRWFRRAGYRPRRFVAGNGAYAFTAWLRKEAP